MPVFCLQTIQNQCQSIKFLMDYYILFRRVFLQPKIYSSIGSEQGQLLMACFCGLIVWLLVFRSNHSSKELNGGGANQSVAVKSELLMGFWLSLLMHLASFMSIWHCCLCQGTVVRGVLVHGKINLLTLADFTSAFLRRMFSHFFIKTAFVYIFAGNIKNVN